MNLKPLPYIIIYLTVKKTAIYCKTLYISMPLMLAKLAMRYHSLTFVVAKINVYCCACAVVCHVVSKVENGIPPCTAGCKKENSRPFCCEVVMTHVLVHLRKIGAWSKYERKSGENVANTIIMTLKCEPKWPSTRAYTETSPLL